MRGKTGLLLGGLCVICLMAFHVQGVCAEDLTPEQLIDKHLEAFGLKSGSTQIKSIQFVGNTDVEFLQGMAGKMSGIAALTSQGSKIFLNMKFDDVNYPGEYFAYDGKSVSVNNIQPGVRTPLADFIFAYNKVMKNGMFGGVFSNAWPLLNIKTSKPSYMNVRKTKVEGKELYELEYRPRDRHGDMKIRIFFETDTYRHVRTEYKVSLDNDASTGTYGNPEDDYERDIPAISGMVTGSTYYTLVEKFGDFKEVGALTMPHSYSLNYDLDGIARHAFIGRWKIDIMMIGFNAENIEPALFKAKN